MAQTLSKFWKVSTDTSDTSKPTRQKLSISLMEVPGSTKNVGPMHCQSLNAKGQLSQLSINHQLMT